MKIKYFFYILLTVIILQSCGNQSPIIDGSTPFVVGKIEKLSETHSEYYSISRKSGAINDFEGKPMIILPSRMYQIGDTIKSNFNGN